MVLILGLVFHRGFFYLTHGRLYGIVIRLSFGLNVHMSDSIRSKPSGHL